MIQEFSAVCWLFGKELSNELKVRDRHISCKRIYKLSMCNPVLSLSTGSANTEYTKATDIAVHAALEKS